MSFQNKYLKYKSKYFDLKNKIAQEGGIFINPPNERCTQIVKNWLDNIIINKNRPTYQEIKLLSRNNSITIDEIEACLKYFKINIPYYPKYDKLNNDNMTQVNADTLSESTSESNKITQTGGSTVNTLKQQNINVGDLVRVTTTTSYGTIVREGSITKKLVDTKTQLPLFLILPPDSTNPFEAILDSNTKIEKIDKIINVGDLVRVTTTTRDGTTVREGLITTKSVDTKTQLPQFLILHQGIITLPFEAILDSNTKIEKIDKIINVGDLVRVTTSRDGTIVREGSITKKSVDTKTHLPLFLILPPDSTNPFEAILDSNTKIDIIDKMYTLPKPYKRDDTNIKVTEQEQINNLRERISNLEFKNEKLERKLNNHYHELPTSGMRLYEEQHPFFKKS
jgi:hypothetical protein